MTDAKKPLAERLGWYLDGDVIRANTGVWCVPATEREMKLLAIIDEIVAENEKLKKALEDKCRARSRDDAIARAEQVVKE